ncbi:MAG: biotin transporter BioY [Ignavibacteriales bacterium]|nr:biotin transporter BioY [Ignavibacteriales bacterium]
MNKTINATVKSLFSVSGIKTNEIFWILSFYLVTVASAQVVIPSFPAPFTLQTMAVLLSAAFLGSKNAAYTQMLYILTGFLGLPVFAGFSGGMLVILGPTAGYLLAFPVAAFIAGYLIEKNKSLVSVVFSMTLASAIIVLSGALYLATVLGLEVYDALFKGAIIFSPFDILKISAAAAIYSSFAKKYPRLPKI